MTNPGEVRFTLHRIDDRTAFELLNKVRDSLGITDQIVLKLAYGIDLPVNKYGEENIFVGRRNIPEAHISGMSSVTGHHFSLAFYRFDPSLELSKRSINPRYDYALLSLGNLTSYWQDNPKIALDVIKIITEHEALPEHEESESGDPAVLRELIISQNATHSRMLDDLNNALADMIKRKAELEQEAHTAEQQRKAEHQQAIEHLEKEKLALERQSHMAERRRIQTQLRMPHEDGRKTVAQTVSGGYAAPLVFLAAITLGVGAGYLAYLGIIVHDVRFGGLNELLGAIRTGEYLEPPDVQAFLDTYYGAVNWYLVARSVLATFVSIGAFAYAFSWMKRVHDEKRSERLARNAFLDDVARASWIIEAIHEVKHEQKGELPSEWVEAVTRNLFMTSQSPNGSDDSTLAIKALLGYAASAKVGPDGAEMQFKRPGLRQLAGGE